MRCLFRTLLIVIALNVASIGRADEPATRSNRRAWQALEWKMAAPSPFNRVESPTAIVDGQLYLFGGFTEELQASNQVDVYDPVTDTWSRKKNMPAGLTHLNPAIDGKTIWFSSTTR